MNTKKQIVIAALSLLMYATAYAQVGIYTENVHKSAVFEIVSPNHDQGVILPFLDDKQQADIQDPADGLIVYNPKTSCFHYYKKGLGWYDICGKQTASIDTVCAKLMLTPNSKYTRNQRLDATNTLTLHCYVTKPGEYSVSAIWEVTQSIGLKIMLQSKVL